MLLKSDVAMKAALLALVGCGLGCGPSKQVESLCDAISRGALEDVKSILEANKIDLNADQDSPRVQCRPVLRVIERVSLIKDSKSLEMMRALFDHGADPNGCWNEGAVRVARNTRSNRKCVPEYALDSKVEAFIELVRERGGKATGNSAGALLVAAREGKLDLVKSLVQNGAPVTDALGQAVKNLHFDVVAYLDTLPGANEFPPPRDPGPIDKAFAAAVDGNVEGGLNAAEQAFMTAARKGDTEAVRAGLAKGVNIDRLDDYSFSALMRAAAWDNLDTVNVLLAAGARPGLMDNGKTALHLAAQFGRIGIIKALLRAGAPINARFSERDPTPLFAAVKAGQAGAVGVLVDAGADATAGSSTQTALEYAIWLADVDVVRELVKGGRAPVNVRGPGATESPLHAAIRCKNDDANVSLMQTLIDAGANLSAKDKNGDTPLQMIEKRRAAEKLASYLPCYDAEIAVLKAASTRSRP
jgi:ankyrin repeat protein